MLTWVLMITNARRPGWEGDVVIPGAIELGLVIPSKVRPVKIHAVKTASLRLVGRLDDVTMREVDTVLRDIMQPLAPATAP